ncbi:CDC42 small effector protein 2-like [Mya arenaria]|uniref:CDC42 small effector protein 2-like n=1 Tax=Mya arenaria TaxID=6604 RepID=UPI0022E6BBB8|nr:CDC42 small effector protein 2-like [Mya arenaria]
MAMGMICFNCCITEQPQPRRRRIDRSMIGEPTDFRHTAHVGSSDITSRGSSNSLSSLQGQMSSKGNSVETSSNAIHLNVIDLPQRRNI